MKKMIQIAAMFLFVFSTAAWAQQDPFVGTWKGNAAKSTYNPGTPPAQGNTTKMEAVPNGIKVTTTNPPNAQGVSTSTEWTAYYDGKDYAMKDTSNAYDSISLKKTGARTLEAISKKGGKAIRTSQWSVSADGKTLTRTSKGTNAQGQAVSSTIVYDKQ